MQMLSVVIITYNEEKNIGRCLDSVQSIANEIVILDSYSTDNTVTIAVSKGATVYNNSFEGYIEQKNKALSLARYDLVLSLDADEALDEQLNASINAVKQHADRMGYTMNRCTNYCGRYIRHGSWYPDVKLRLFNRNFVKWGGVNPHDKAEFIAKPNARHLRGDILHYSYETLEEHVNQNNKFSTISAEALFKRGKRTGWVKILFNPFWAFMVGYFVRLGFLDGYYGLVIAVNTAHLTFLKYIKLYQKQKEVH
ncbi:MAG: glycosyltransferase family 2 protein [Chitinophagaceae bacterium]